MVATDGSTLVCRDISVTLTRLFFLQRNGHTYTRHTPPLTTTLNATTTLAYGVVVDAFSAGFFAASLRPL